MTLIDRNRSSNIGPSVRGVASGVLFLALFGALWAVTGMQGLHGQSPAWIFAVMLALGLVLLGGGVSLVRAARRLPNSVREAGTQQRRRRNRWFRILFVTEAILIGIALAVCRLVNRFDLFLPLTMLIVGIHFFPLAVVFRVKDYHVAGALLCALAIFTLLAVPERLRVGGSVSVAAWWVVLGFGGAFILWGVGFFHWLLGRRLLSRMNQ